MPIPERRTQRRVTAVANLERPVCVLASIVAVGVANPLAEGASPDNWILSHRRIERTGLLARHIGQTAVGRGIDLLAVLRWIVGGRPDVDGWTLRPARITGIDQSIELSPRGAAVGGDGGDALIAVAFAHPLWVEIAIGLLRGGGGNTWR